LFELLLDVMDLRDTNAECAIALNPIIESARTPARITPYPTGRLFWGGAFPGTSCLATIAPFLRDISKLEYRWLFVSPAISQANRSDRQPVMD
jgi:hypothetical protein